MKRVLVTGGSGWIGRHTLHQLVERGYEVHAVSRRGIRLLTSNTECRWHEANLLHEHEVAELMREVKPTHLLHFAWEVTPGAYVKSMDNFLWVQSSLSLVNYFRQYGGERVVVAGTCAEYDWDSGYFTEDYTPCSYKTPYATSKNAFRLLLQSMSEFTDFSSCWGRVFFLYGPGEHRRRLVPSIVSPLLENAKAACTHGDQYRDFLHVHDVASAFVAILDCDVEGTINVASGHSIQVKELVAMIAKKMDRYHLVNFGEIPFSPTDPIFIGANTKRLNEEVGWKPRFDLEEGLEDTISWWKNEIMGGE